MVSLLNGLSAAGAGIAQFAGTAGLEQQKTDLANQSAMLANQLATERETTLQQSRQTFEAGQTQQQLAATAAENAANRAAELQRTNLTINAPTEFQKDITFLRGGQPSSQTSPTISTPSNQPGSATGNPVSASSSGAITSPVSTGNPLQDALIAKRFGTGAPGSEQANRASIARDVDNDPKFQNASDGAKAAEVETRFGIATGKLTSPESREQMAQGIASYQFSPPQGRALIEADGQKLMARVRQLNPDYQQARFNEMNKVMEDFGTGPRGNTVTSLNVAVQHLAVLEQAGQALDNPTIPAVNALKLAFQRQYGSAPPATFDALKQIVGAEVVKAVTGGIGAEGDRDRIAEDFKTANSPEQLQGVINGLRSLMVGQLSGLKQQYEDGTGFKAGPFTFEHKLAPETVSALQGRAGGSAAPTPSQANATPTAAPAAAQNPVMDAGRLRAGVTAPQTPAQPLWNYRAVGDKGFTAYSKDGKTWFNQDGSPLSSTPKSGGQ